MDQKIREFVTEKTNDLLQAFSCCKEAKAAGEAWLKAAGTPDEAAVTEQYLNELAADIIPIDGLISFAESEAGAGVFGGAEKAKEVAAHGREIKAKGAKYCDCPACAACEAILAKKDEILK